MARAGLAVSVVLALGSRLGVIATALAVSHSEARTALVAGGVTTLCLAAQRLVQLLTRTRIERDIHRAIVEVLMETDVLDVARERTQRVVFEGSYHAVPLVGVLLPTLVSDVVATVVVVPVLMATFPERVLGAAAVAILVIGAMMVVVRRLAQAGEERLAAAYEEVADSLLIAVEGRLELVARGAERMFAARFSALADRYVQQADRMGLASAWLGRVPLLVGAIAVAAIAVVDESSRAELTSALVSRALVLAACLPALLGTVIGVQAVARTTTLVRPLARLLLEKRRCEPSDAASAPSLPATFEVDGVSFRYADDRPFVVSDVSLTWTVAEPLALVGENGSGKSTLLKLLMGLRPPTLGTIRIDGRESTEIDVRALRRGISYLPQRPYLGEAHGTLRAAVRMAVPNASDSEIEHALTKVRLLEALRARDGEALDVTVGSLSAGQRQRLALARVLLQRAPVVILDEPDANLDRDGIALVHELVTVMVARGRMVALAAHTPELAALSSRPISLGRTSRQA